MILLVDSEGPDQTMDVYADLGLPYLPMPEDMFPQGTAQMKLRNRKHYHNYYHMPYEHTHDKTYIGLMED